MATACTRPVRVPRLPRPLREGARQSDAAILREEIARAARPAGGRIEQRATCRFYFACVDSCNELVYFTSFIVPATRDVTINVS